MRVMMLTLLALAAVVVHAAPTGDADGLLLYDFENAADLAGWSVRAQTQFAQTTAWAAHGRAAAAITYEQYAPGKEQWPAVIATAANGTLAVSDFTPFAALQFTVYDPQDAPAEIKVHIRDSSGARFAMPFSVGSKQASVLSVPVRDIAATINAAAVAELHFYVSQPARTYTLYVDAVRLTLDLRARSADLAREAIALQQQVALLKLSLQALPADLREGVVTLPRLQDQAVALRDRVASGKIASYDEALATRRRADRLARELQAVRPLVPRLQAAAYARTQQADQFVLGVESPMQKVFLDKSRFASRFEGTQTLSAARNEHESLQVIVFPLEGDLKNVTWHLSPLGNGKGGTLPATVRVVGYVDCKQPSYGTPGPGWYPDPLLDFMSSVPVVPAAEVLPLWLTVSVPKDAAAGDYTGHLTVSADGARPQEVRLRVRVWDFMLPDHSSLRTALSFRGLSSKLYPEDKLPEMNRRYEDWMLQEYHLNPGSIYGQVPTWDAARLRELKAVGLNAINLSYINAPTGKDFKPEAFWRKLDEQAAKIEDYMRVVTEAGVRDLCYIYCFDERPTSERDIVFQTATRLHQRFAGIPVMTTAYDPSFGLDRPDGAAMDIWVPLTPKFDVNAAKVAEARQAGRDIWWYICIGPQHPYANWFVEYPAIEARLLMGAMTAKYRPGGFLYYAVNRWPLNDTLITTGPRTDWNPASYQINNGDGSIMCAGVNGPLATIRLENIRDGMEDYETYLLLRKLLAEGKLPGDRAEVPAALVQDLTHFTRDPQAVVQERERLAKEILRLSK
ncbi:DUF4091 domain-containing protein [bacterium]|nr:DUF4091 domain-containing protein [bacterium]